MAQPLAKVSGAKQNKNKRLVAVLSEVRQQLLKYIFLIQNIKETHFFLAILSIEIA